MNFSHELKIYFCINLLLVITYLLFVAIKKLSVHLNYRHRIIIGQVLITLSILAPFGFQLLPQRTLPPLQWGALFVPADKNIKSIQPLKKSLVHSQNLELLVAQKSLGDWFISRLNIETCLLIFLSVGFIATLLRLLINIRGLTQILSNSIRLHCIGRIRVVLEEHITIPFSVKLWSGSWVVLPMALLSNRRDLQLALKHELHHHRQGDTTWAVVVELLLCVFFPNPALYLWKREITELQEFSCDEYLIGQKRISSRDYGRCLIRVAEAALESRQMYVGTTYMAAMNKNYHKSFLRRRIEMITSQERPRRYRMASFIAGTLAVTLTMALAYGTEQSLRGKNPDEVNAGKLTVDPEIQLIAQKVLAMAVKTQKAKAGIAIVADPMTGKILAVVSIDKTNGKKKLLGLAEAIEPASFFKGIVVAEAIDKGLTTSQEKHNCENGTYRYGKEVYHDWKDGGWPELTTLETIENSSNICAMKIGEKIGVAGLRQMLEDFGFGPEGTAQDFPEARTGVLPPPEDPQNPKTIPYVTSGFGFRVTPLEMVQAYGAIANGGRLLMPISVDAKSASAHVVRRVLSEESSEKTKEILRNVVLNGTGKHAASELYTTAGKTATSYIPDLTDLYLIRGKQNGNFAGFIGFAPVKNPRVEVYVGIYDPQSGKGGAHGGEHAAPVFKQIAEGVLQHMNVAPDKTQM